MLQKGSQCTINTVIFFQEYLNLSLVILEKRVDRFFKKTRNTIKRTKYTQTKTHTQIVTDSHSQLHRQTDTQRLKNKHGKEKKIATQTDTHRHGHRHTQTLREREIHTKTVQ